MPQISSKALRPLALLGDHRTATAEVPIAREAGGPPPVSAQHRGMVLPCLPKTPKT